MEMSDREKRIHQAKCISETYDVALSFDLELDIQNFQLHDDVYEFLIEFMRKFNITFADLKE